MQSVDQLIAAEVLAISVCDLFPGAELVGGQGNQVGFTCNFLISQPIDEQAIPLIEEKMRGLIKQEIPIEILDMMRENAAALLEFHHQPVKAEMASRAHHNIIKIIRIGNFHDYIPSDTEELPIGEHTGLAGAIKLLSLRRETKYIPGFGDVPIVQIEGAAAKDRQHLKQFLKKYEAAKQFDPIVLGQDMDLFSTHEQAVDGGWFWHPKGMILRDILTKLWKETLYSAGFQFLSTPGIVKRSLLDKKSTYTTFEMDGLDYVPFPDKASYHAFLFGSQSRSSLELPMRFAEYAEKFEPFDKSFAPGHDPARIYNADSLQIFCNEEQIHTELISSLQFFDKTITILGFEYQWYFIASRGKNSAGAPAKWKQSAEWIAKALKSCGLEYQDDESGTVLDGPRVEMRLLDPLGRQWTGPWIGIDWKRPEQFALRYQGSDGKMHRPLMINGALFGSIERLVALLLECFQGHLPLWLAPEQVRILPVGSRHWETAKAIGNAIRDANFRVTIDPKDETLGCKVHAAEKARIPYILIVGDKEVKESFITVRSCNKEGLRSGVKLEHFLKQLEEDACRK